MQENGLQGVHTAIRVGMCKVLLFSCLTWEKPGESIEVTPFALRLCQALTPGHAGLSLTAAPAFHFSEALYPERCPPGAPGPRLDGGEWSPGPDGVQRQAGGGHLDR